jgi:hypothetical protein
MFVEKKFSTKEKKWPKVIYLKWRFDNKSFVPRRNKDWAEAEDKSLKNVMDEKSWKLVTGWKDWANFRLLSDCVLGKVFLKIIEVAKIYFSHGKKFCIIHFANILGDFFTNSSGHPDWRLVNLINLRCWSNSSVSHINVISISDTLNLTLSSVKWIFQFALKLPCKNMRQHFFIYEKETSMKFLFFLNFKFLFPSHHFFCSGGPIFLLS